MKHYNHFNFSDCTNPQLFTDFRKMVLRKGQTAFLMTVVWTQIANLLIRKTMVATIFTFDRLFKNKVMIQSLIFEIVLIVLLVYVPGLNSFFTLDSITSAQASCGLWMMPFIIGWDELRKYLIRQKPKGALAKYTLF